MSGSAQMKLGILFAHELRLAHELLERARTSKDIEEVAAAFHAARIALYHATPDYKLVVIELSDAEREEIAALQKAEPVPPKEPQ